MWLFFALRACYFNVNKPEWWEGIKKGIVLGVCASFCQWGGLPRGGGAPSWSGQVTAVLCQSVSQASPRRWVRWPFLPEVAFGVQCLWRKKEGRCRKGKKVPVEKMKGLSTIWELQMSWGCKVPLCTAMSSFLPLVHTPTCISHSSRHTVRWASRTHSLVQSSAIRHLVNTYYMQNSLHSSPGPA